MHTTLTVDEINALIELAKHVVAWTVIGAGLALFIGWFIIWLD